MSAGPSSGIWRRSAMTEFSSIDYLKPLVIEGHSISTAYAQLLLHILTHSGNEVAPVVLTVDGFGSGYEIPEDAAVRAALDKLLAAKGKLSVEDVRQLSRTRPT